MVFDSDLVRRSELSGREMAKLLKVSRITVINWKTQKYSPTANVENRVIKFMEVLRKAVDAGDLPLKGVLRHERFPVIVQALKKHNT